MEVKARRAWVRPAVKTEPAQPNVALLVCSATFWDCDVNGYPGCGCQKKSGSDPALDCGNSCGL